jgi:hypothetical protein
MIRNGGEVVVYQFMRTVLPHLRACFNDIDEQFEPLNIPPARVWFCK